MSDDNKIRDAVSQAKSRLKNLPSQEDIMAGWPSGDKIFLSIACITFNHEKYIEDTLAGFLSQKTSFRFDIVVHDDASSDGTADILRQYQEEYPKLIRLIIQKENQYSKGNRPIINIYPELRGNYIAVCEGDDYWIDPHKLQKQVEFLEENSEFVMSGHDACIINDNGDLLKDSKLPDPYKRDYTARELQEGRAFILTLSWVFRRVLAGDEAKAERSVVTNGDRFTLSLLGQHGAAHYHDDILPAVYRVHEGGVWSMLDNKSRVRSHILTYLMISNYYRRSGQSDLADVWNSQVDKLITKQFSTVMLLKELIIRISFLRTIRSMLGRAKALLMKAYK